MVDGDTDVSNKEQVVVCFHSIDETLSLMNVLLEFMLSKVLKAIQVNVEDEFAPE